MKRIILAVAAIALAAPAAVAQTTTTTTTTVETTKEPDYDTIRTYVTKEKHESVAAPDGYTVTVGTALPEPVPLYRLPDNVGPYEYAVVDGHTVLVDDNRNIVKIID
ncbi:DUF1236 domain-containing protein [Jiella sonneratiae]|uniref:DUF1236 domain-containing protein n=1 Tax=Jiella sonneratiae TaxID=2816856 RepID=A0ABS3IZY7_9HYPH|nr:DUF1236 domain-containing protein [Jiella sonneratiae]MBO0902377.1 DUF1236 domain-containing protein [Jiella sonneratiae]